MMNMRDKFTIYFLKPVGAAGPIKIGLSSNPAKRLTECGSWSPVPLELFGTAPGSWADEQFLHECLAKYHSHGEWFFAGPPVLQAIEEVLKEQGFDWVRANLSPVANVRSLKNIASRAAKAAQAQKEGVA